MNRLTKKLATALISLGALSGTISDASACPGGGGGGGHRFIGGGHHRPHHAQPRYVQPAPQPYYQQPYYPQPAPQQPMANYGQSGYGQPNPQFAGQPNVLPPTVKKMANVRPSGAANPQFSQGGQFQAQQPGGQQFAGQQPSGQQFNGQPGMSQAAPRTGGQLARQTGGGQASVNALQALGGSPVQNQDQQQVSQPQFNQSQGGQQEFAQSQGGQNQAAPQRMARRPQTQMAQQQQQPEQSSSPMGEAQMSALDALGGFDSEEPQQLEAQAEQSEQAVSFEEEAQPVQAARSNSGRPSNQQMHVGSWTASLQNGSKVELTLQPDGSFSWVATSGEKVSSFDGNYTVSGGSLTLVRSSDNQKLIGAMTPAGASSFTFKLTGTKDAGLNFSRS